NAPAARDVEVDVNGVKAKASMAAGWQTLAVPLADGAARAGENDIKLAFGKKPGDGVAIEWLQVGGAAPPDATPAAFAGRALALSKTVGVSYYVMVPKGGKLVGNATCPVAVRARGGDGKGVDGELRGAEGSVDLAALAGQVVRLRLSGTCDDARVTGAALAT